MSHPPPPEKEIRLKLLYETQDGTFAVIDLELAGHANMSMILNV